MNGVMTATRSQTDTFTEARLAAVMPEVGADFYAMASAGLITMATAQHWTEELTFVLKHQAAHGFQIQLRCPGRDRSRSITASAATAPCMRAARAAALTIRLPEGTHAVCSSTSTIRRRRSRLFEPIPRQRGWGTNGQAVPGDPVRDRAYSKDGYGVVRGKVGDWP